MNQVIAERPAYFNNLTNLEKQAALQSEFFKTSTFQAQFLHDSVNLDFHLFQAKFTADIQRLLIKKNIIDHIVPLEELHLLLKPELKRYDFHDGVNLISTQFYDTDADFIDLYHRFIKEFLYQQVFKQPFWFQATPTIRIHCPKAENSHHYPRYHSDIVYGHPPQEINLWMPLTQRRIGHGFKLANVADSIQLLQQYDFDAEKFVYNAVHNANLTVQCHQVAPEVATELGQILLFDARCLHTGVPLVEHTRVSIDARIILAKDFDSNPWIYQGSGRKKILFVPGGCYSLLRSDQL